MANHFHASTATTRAATNATFGSTKNYTKRANSSATYVASYSVIRCVSMPTVTLMLAQSLAVYAECHSRRTVASTTTSVHIIRNEAQRVAPLALGLPIRQPAIIVRGAEALVQFRIEVKQHLPFLLRSINY